MTPGCFQHEWPTGTRMLFREHNAQYNGRAKPGSFAPIIMFHGRFAATSLSSASHSVCVSSHPLETAGRGAFVCLALAVGPWPLPQASEYWHSLGCAHRGVTPRSRSAERATGHREVERCRPSVSIEFGVGRDPQPPARAQGGPRDPDLRATAHEAMRLAHTPHTFW